MGVSERAKTALVTLSEYDIPELIKLSESIGWDYDRDEIQTVMASGKVYGHKTEEGKIVSSAAIVPYGSNLASIGMVIVHKDFRGKGLGREVTQKCLESVSPNRTVMLISTEEGKPLYKSLGFSSVDNVHKYLCDTYFSMKCQNVLDVEIIPMRKEDFSHVLKLDKGAFGEDRSTFLINRIKQAKESLVVKSSDGNIIGYGLSILGPINLILGPIVAPDDYIAYALVDQLASNHQGKLRIDIPSGKERFMSKLDKCGFVKVSEPPVMIKNSEQLPHRNKTLYGIAAQIFG